MESINTKEVINGLSKLKSMACAITPDRYKWMCEKNNISEREAMDMYSWFKDLSKGVLPYKDGAILKEEHIAKIVDIAEQAYTQHIKYEHFISNIHGFVYKAGYDYTNVLYFIEREGEKKRLELSLRDQESYLLLADLIKQGYKIQSMACQADIVYSTNTYLGEANTDKVIIYDGDVILAYVEKPEFWSTDHTKSGLYICRNGCYKRLVYTPGKGYIRRGRVDEDEDFEVEINQKNCFRSTVFTMFQKWEIVGNVHESIDFLIES